MSGWIKCSDRLPESHRDVLVYCSDTLEQFVAFHNKRSGVFQFAMDHEGNSICCTPTHWQSLPSPSTE